jgi:hypothetical protein
MQGELEKTKSQVKLQEDENNQKENKKKDVSREFTQIIQSIRNLYGRCHSTMRVKSVFSGPKDVLNLSDVLDTELDLISTRIVDLIEITNEFKSEAYLQDYNNTGSLSVISTENSRYSTGMNTTGQPSNTSKTQKM